MPNGLKISQMPHFPFSDAVQQNVQIPVAYNTNNARIGAADISSYMSDLIIGALDGAAEAQDLEELRQRVENAEYEIEQNSLNILSNAGNIETLSVSYAGIKTQLNAFDSVMNEIQTNVTNLQIRTDTLENGLESLTNRVSTAEGNITALQTNVTTIQGQITTINNQITALQGNYDSLAQRVTANESDISDIQTTVTAINNQITAIGGQISVIDDIIASIRSVISSKASAANKLLSESEIDAKIAMLAARYLTYTSQGDNFPTKASLTFAAAFYFSGTNVTPSAHDYIYIQDDESKNNGITRYSYDGTQWDLEFEVPDVNFSQTQWEAVNSGITAGLVTDLNALKTNTIQTLTGGAAISISGSGTSRTISHASVTRTNPSNTSQAPGYGGTFNVVESVTTNAQGHVTATQTKTITMPEAQNLPTVNNGTLTIQQNGITIGTFSANQSENAIAEITVPDISGFAWKQIYLGKISLIPPSSGYVPANMILFRAPRLASQSRIKYFVFSYGYQATSTGVGYGSGVRIIMANCIGDSSIISGKICETSFGPSFIGSSFIFYLSYDSSYYYINLRPANFDPYIKTISVYDIGSGYLVIGQDNSIWEPVFELSPLKGSILASSDVI